MSKDFISIGETLFSGYFPKPSDNLVKLFNEALKPTENPLPAYLDKLTVLIDD